VKQTFVLQPKPHPARDRAMNALRDAPDGYVVQISEPTRSLNANAAMWPILEAFSQQLQWPVNGLMTLLTPEEWKDILSAAFFQQQPRVAMGLSGGMVLLGQRTSKFSKKQFSDWLDFINSIAIDRGVVVYPVDDYA
jgi:hypothetical protein